MDDDLLRGRVTAAPAANPVELTSRLATACDVDQCRPSILQAPERSCGPVRDDGSVTAGECRCPKGAKSTDGKMTDRVHTPMNAVEASFSSPMLRRPLS